MVKRVLMVAYHFPPMSASSGIQRTLRFAQYLPEHDWQPIVLTANPRAYSLASQAALAEVPRDLQVSRAFALDSAKHFALWGRYPKVLCIPDRWWTWWLGAVPTGLSLIRKCRPNVIWSTYPVATAHLVGYTLHRLTGIPWVADFRDPMAQDDYPRDRLQHRAFQWIEGRTLAHCSHAVFTTPGALRMYADRYPEVPRSRLTLIENGYDEHAFSAANQQVGFRDCAGRPLVLLHSGTIYPSERDPRCFLDALSALRRAGDISSKTLHVVFRAPGCDEYMQRLISQYRVDDIVRIEPALPYRDALSEMISVDALLILQAASCNYQIPAKLYEYIRARRPIFALTTPEGDTASALLDAGIDTIVPLDAADQISRGLLRFIDLLRRRLAPLPRAPAIAAASRKARTGQFAMLLDTVAGHSTAVDARPCL